jgi:hypothetical protein
MNKKPLRASCVEPARLGSRRAQFELDVICHKVCPKLTPTSGAELVCNEGHHTRPTADYHAAFHWSILLLALCLTVGSISRFCIPTWIPYTVAVLLIGILLGMLAFFLEARESCPLKCAHHTLAPAPHPPPKPRNPKCARHACSRRWRVLAAAPLAPPPATSPLSPPTRARSAERHALDGKHRSRYSC